MWSGVSRSKSQSDLLRSLVGLCGSAHCLAYSCSSVGVTSFTFSEHADDLCGQSIKIDVPGHPKDTQSQLRKSHVH